MELEMMGMGGENGYKPETTEQIIERKLKQIERDKERVLHLVELTKILPNRISETIALLKTINDLKIGESHSSSRTHNKRKTNITLTRLSDSSFMREEDTFNLENELILTNSQIYSNTQANFYVSDIIARKYSPYIRY
jgi:hypothetical protein